MANSDNTGKTSHTETTPSVKIEAPAPIAPTPEVVVQPIAASAVEAVSAVPAGVAGVSNSETMGWVKLSESADGELTFYANASTIRKTGDKATILTLSDFKTSKNSKSGKSYRSNTNQDEYDCKENKERLLNIISAYSENMGRGEIAVTNAGSNPVPSEWSQVTPNSLEDSIFKIACAQK